MPGLDKTRLSAKNRYLFSAETHDTSGKLAGYSILVFTPGSVKLVARRTRGFLLAGLLFLLIVWAYFAILIIPFVVFHVPPVTIWEPWQRIIFGLGVLVGFVLILFRVISPLIPTVEVRYPERIKEGKIVGVTNRGRREREITFQSDGTTLSLFVNASRFKLEKAIELARPRASPSGS